MSAAPDLNTLVVAPKNEDRRSIRPALAAPLETATPWHDSFVETSHARIAVRQTRGASLPVLFLHGNSSSKAVFQGQFADRLGAEHHLIAIDFPGHGDSGDAHDPSRTYTMTGYADATLEVLELLGIDQALVVGWSLGGHVGLELSTVFPGLLGLMITGTSPVGNGQDAIWNGFRPHPHLALAGSRALSTVDVTDFAKLTLGAAAHPGLVDAIRRTDGRARAVMFEDLFAGGPSDQRRISETSTIPLAVVNGSEDPIVNVDYLTQLAYAKLWKGRCHVLPKLGHAPFLEMPAVFNELLAHFIRDVEMASHSRLESDSLCYSG